MQRRVVITGMGTVNPLARTVPAFWEALCAGRSGIDIIRQFDPAEFKVRIAGEVKAFDPAAELGAKAAQRLDRFSQFALVSALQAVAESGIDFSREDPYRCGVTLGCGIGGLNEFEEGHARYAQGGARKVSPFIIPKMMPNAAPATLSIHFGLGGASTAVASACASSADAVGEAFRAIRGGYADVMLTGGAEAPITPVGLSGFMAARSLSTRNEDPAAASRPFDRDRDGFVLSEGAGIVVLEELERARKRGAVIYAELLGTASTSDAHHITAPQPEGVGAARAVEEALRDAGLRPEEIDYVNAHATSTGLGDIAETRALKHAFGPHASRLAVSSIKSMTGHLCGASGAVELIATALALQHGAIPPTLNLENPDPECDLDYVPRVARESPIRRAVSTSFGFGGHNGCLVVGKME